jgi:hypothetical protein
MLKITFFALLLIFQLNCASHSANQQSASAPNSDPREAPTAPEKSNDRIDDFGAKIKEILPEGWDISRADNKLTVARRDPVFLYGAISLPSAGLGRREAVESGKRAVEYKITLEFSNRLTEEEYQALRKVNRETDQKLGIISYPMRGFASKGDYEPRTGKEEKLYEEYKQALRTLPFNRLPELYDDEFAVYIDSTRRSRTAFYSPREESECRAVMDNIFSFAEPYGQREDSFGEMFFTESRVAEAFRGSREYDDYLDNKERNLRP